MKQTLSKKMQVNNVASSVEEGVYRYHIICMQKCQFAWQMAKYDFLPKPKTSQKSKLTSVQRINVWASNVTLLPLLPSSIWLSDTIVIFPWGWFWLLILFHVLSFSFIPQNGSFRVRARTHPHPHTHRDDLSLSHAEARIHSLSLSLSNTQVPQTHTHPHQRHAHTHTHTHTTISTQYAHTYTHTYTHTHECCQNEVHTKSQQ